VNVSGVVIQLVREGGRLNYILFVRDRSAADIVKVADTGAHADALILKAL
jgi:hypothetical protein